MEQVTENTELGTRCERYEVRGAIRRVLLDRLNSFGSFGILDYLKIPEFTRGMSTMESRDP